MQPDQSTRLLNMHDMRARLRLCASRIRLDVHQGLLPSPIKRGIRCTRWVEHEVDSVLRARIAGADDTAVRALVQRLLTRRAEAAALLAA